MENTKAKKSFQAPHTFVILVALILIAVAATYVVPAGEYTRYVDEATGRTLVEAGSFHYVDSNPAASSETSQTGTLEMSQQLKQHLSYCLTAHSDSEALLQRFVLT